MRDKTGTFPSLKSSGDFGTLEPELLTLLFSNAKGPFGGICWCEIPELLTPEGSVGILGGPYGLPLMSFLLTPLLGEPDNWFLGVRTISFLMFSCSARGFDSL
uniref:Uncharacterized protein n=1 Tax=Cacopsylla melanoneura TaxID=428564 RepID=A0A8D8XG90_9HEMI